MEILLDIRRDMAHEVDYDTDLFAEVVRNGRHTSGHRTYSLVYEDNGRPAKKVAPTESKKK
ncbi:MAG TPA: hypothetical protein VNA22_00840 [Pyrinomonadaceae bacterium]|nr:hypothetical protein [Pyrinomonadaceae bacterium]